MARTGRPKAPNPRVQVHVGLNPIHHGVFEQLEPDFFTGKRARGTRDSHIDKALEEYFQKNYPDLLAAERAKVGS